MDHLDRLTRREYEVFSMLAIGGSNTEIADALCVSERSVRAHLAAIRRKLELASRLHVCLASYAHLVEREAAAVASALNGDERDCG